VLIVLMTAYLEVILSRRWSFCPRRERYAFGFTLLLSAPRALCVRLHPILTNRIPRISMQWALCTNRSRMSSASVGSLLVRARARLAVAKSGSLERTW
jgi:hypothetical protein